ncbi:tubulin-tyrosine ligase [Bodo saltans virus]|uniref:Tubulin-tyrosine ligase n=1 Tax=Bodo saltans virus TaxID=2024608 RepID=A0A2H4UV34_9VIRU|nr:tubulin-tyrosine ligase [Bodo saltans virus]ATZ80780.1 tubulin-tyrosine ligase [Bodo saltans virus]
MRENVNENMENIETNDDAKNITWNRNKCLYSFGDSFEDVFSKNNMKQNENKWDIYLPCNYDNLNKEIDEMPIVKDAKYFIIDGIDEFVAKNSLWGNLVKHYGLTRAKKYMPMTYELFVDDDIEKIKNEYDSNKIYIMKKNIQRQEGLKITNNLNEMILGRNEGYVVAQELLQNPYIIDGRKTNMRFYVLIINDKGNKKVLIHKEGFMYYTKVPFKKNSLDIDTNITTGYIDREVYEKNPLTHNDLRKYLDDQNRNLSQIEINIRSQGLHISQIYFQRIYDMLKEVFLAFFGKFGKSPKLSNNMTFQLFGVDVAVDDELNPMIMEINKGPDVGQKSIRDSQVKQNVVLDIFKSINAIDDKNNDFINVLESKRDLLV